MGFDDLMARAGTIEVQGRRVQLATLDAVVRSKQVANRPKDHEALPELRSLMGHENARD